MSKNRNEDRLGPKVSVADPLPISSEASVPLNFTTPTEFVDLPTQGKYYPEDHPLYGQKHIEIRYMTAKDEDILTSKSLLRKGIAIDRFLQNVIVDKRIKIDDLFVGDKNAVIVASRITGYGAEYTTRLKCPSCNASFEHTFDLEDSTIHTGSLPDGVELTENGTFLIPLPKMGLRVEVRLLTGKDEKSLSMLLEKKKKHKLPESNLTDQFKMFIVGIQGYKDSYLINELVENMPALDSHHLRTVYKKIVPNIDLTQEVTCEVCESEQELDVPFTTDFFWPKR